VLFDAVWIGMAFILGLLGRQVGLPPLAGYLVAGFLLHALRVDTGDVLAQLAEFGVTLLLFTIGLKLKLQTLVRPEVLGVATVHMAALTLSLTGVLAVLGVLGMGLVDALSGPQTVLVAFAFSYSSTVFAVKFLEARGDMGSNYGRTMIGILIIQDLVAVGFLAFSAGTVPSPWALLLIPGALPARWLLHRLLDRAGHGELFVLFGLFAAVGGAQLFTLVEVKGDLGALLVGVLLADHEAADELSKTMLGFKDLFLVGFFLNVGLTGAPGVDAVVLALILVALVPLKSGLYFWLLTRFRLRARTSVLAALGLSNYSEFGLIVASVAVTQGWLDPAWLGVLAVSLAVSFVAASPANARALELYGRVRPRLSRFERAELVPQERQIDPGPADALVFGMGRIGVGAYDRLVEDGIGRVVGIESSTFVVRRHREAGRVVIVGSGTDLDFWTRAALDFGQLKLVVLSMPKVQENEFAARELRRRGYTGRISAVARFRDHESMLEDAGVTHVFNLYSEAGGGLAEDASRGLVTRG
jgi:predicted Kef-type K+ transport protein